MLACLIKNRKTRNELMMRLMRCQRVHVPMDPKELFYKKKCSRSISKQPRYFANDDEKEKKGVGEGGREV